MSPAETAAVDVVDLDELGRRFRAEHDTYAVAAPFPHVVLDDLLRPEAFAAAVAEFPSDDGSHWTKYLHVNERKYGNTRPVTWGPALRSVADALTSPAFVELLGELTGIEGLVPDPSFDGAGLHRSVTGGFLNVHADFTSHHTHRNWRRRVNLLLYLNESWQPEYGGDLELWDRSMTRAERRVAPLGNRAVIFDTTRTAFHGHPVPLAAPPGVARQSMALYYFTVEDEAEAFSTDYRARPEDGWRHVLIFGDKLALRGYDIGEAPAGSVG